MKLNAALQKINASRSNAEPQWTCGIACGFTPLHFQTFLHACLLDRTDNTFSVSHGLFGDLIGNVQRIIEQHVAKAVIVIEWSDLDPRLGYRVTHGWRQPNQADIQATIAVRLNQLSEQILRLAEQRATIVVSLPALPVPPLTHDSPGMGSSLYFDLHRQTHRFAADLACATSNRVRILCPQQLDRVSPPHERYDIRADLSAGFPYHKQHGFALANELAALLLPPAPLKGIITDLDNTFWQGILGEDGIAGVHWDLDHGAHSHGLYQELLASLAEAGTLIAVASKNDGDLVQKAFQRRELVIDPGAFFPVEAHWDRKSDSVRRILEAWNVGADSVVFIDDSPMEIAEVEAAFPDIHCRRFPTKDDRAILELLLSLRRDFGKTLISEEDRIRLQSLRIAHERSQSASGSDPDDFLADANAEFAFTFDHPDQRTFELINKTNQFNINGRRYDDAEWQARLEEPCFTIVSVSYRDKFGPLGKIAVAVLYCAERVEIESWGMSCRAFSRRIEHRTLETLFERLGCDEIGIAFEPTERNGPAQTFLSTMYGESVDGFLSLSRTRFEENCPAALGVKVMQ